jgi:hypothetical protein
MGGALGRCQQRGLRDEIGLAATRFDHSVPQIVEAPGAPVFEQNRGLVLDIPEP